MKNYDIVIKSGRKDYFKLHMVVDSIKYLNPPPSKIYILSEDGFIPSGTDYGSKLIAVEDHDAEPVILRNRLNHRPNWNWVNLVSLFQNFTEQDLYFDIQSDNFFLQPIDLFDQIGRPKIFRSTANHPNVRGWDPYFNFSQTVFDIPKVSSGFSYIIEFMMYNKNHLKKLTDMYDTFDSMLEVIYSNVNKNSYPADQEIFGNLVEKHFNQEYCFVDDFPVNFTGREFERYGSPSIDDVMNYIESVKNESAQNGNGHTTNVFSCSYHTWT